MSETAPGAHRPASRLILLVSLALNLFFIGAAVALAWRHYAWSPERGPGYWTPAARIERLAAVLPAADAEKLRAVLRERIATIDAANNTYRMVQERLRAALRAEPFSADAARTAMAEARAARAKLDEALQEVIVSASAQMAPESRHRLADWTPYRRSGNEKAR